MAPLPAARRCRSASSGASARKSCSARNGPTRPACGFRCSGWKRRYEQRDPRARAEDGCRAAAARTMALAGRTDRRLCLRSGQRACAQRGLLQPCAVRRAARILRRRRRRRRRGARRDREQRSPVALRAGAEGNLPRPGQAGGLADAGRYAGARSDRAAHRPDRRGDAGRGLVPVAEHGLPAQRGRLPRLPAAAAQAALRHRAAHGGPDLRQLRAAAAAQRQAQRSRAHGRHGRSRQPAGGEDADPRARAAAAVLGRRPQIRLGRADRRGGFRRAQRRPFAGEDLRRAGPRGQAQRQPRRRERAAGAAPALVHAAACARAAPRAGVAESEDKIMRRILLGAALWLSMSVASFAETQSVIDPTEGLEPPKAAAPGPDASLRRERQRAEAEQRRRAKAEARALAAEKESARLRAQEQARQAEAQQAEARKAAAARAAATRAAAARATQARIAAENDAARRQAAARETAARELAAREAALRETAAREAAERDAAAREAKQIAAREAAARLVAARKAAARAATSRNTRGRLAAARDTARDERFSKTPPRLGANFRDCNDCPELIWLPRGEFVMGDGQAENGPRPLVAINYMLAVGRFEVTFAEWDACVAGGGCRRKPHDSGWGRGWQPGVQASRAGAQQYGAGPSRATRASCAAGPGTAPANRCARPRVPPPRPIISTTASASASRARSNAWRSITCCAGTTPRTRISSSGVSSRASAQSCARRRARCSIPAARRSSTARTCGSSGSTRGRCCFPRSSRNSRIARARSTTIATGRSGQTTSFRDSSKNKTSSPPSTRRDT